MFVRAGLRWIESGGGPLVLLQEHQRDRWAGIGDAGWSAGSGTDYDRACGVSGRVGRVRAGEDDALVLGDEPAATAGLSTPHGPMLVRWIHAPVDWSADALDRLPGLAWEPSLRWRVESPRQVLQDAAVGGREVDADRIDLSLRPGRYDILTADYRPDSGVHLILHWLRREGSAGA